MEKINYALAPAGATHTANKGKSWRKIENNILFGWFDCQWNKVDSFDDSFLRREDYTPIPEREQALNRLADNYALWTIPSIARASVSTKGSFGWMWPEDATEGYFAKEEWHDRRYERIAAGLIEENNDLADVNDTDVVEMEWDGNGLPPVGWKGEATKGGTWVAGEVVYHAATGSCLFVDEEEIFAFWAKEFRPIKTAEQLATEKKKEWVGAVDKLWCEADVTTETFLGDLYDALLGGTLDVPKGDL